MKKIILIIIVIIVLFSMSSYDGGFVFRGHRFGDSIEEVEQLDGNDGDITEDNNHNSLFYSNIELYNEFKGNLNYIFADGKLEHIYEIIPYYEKKTIEEVYSNLKGELDRYGSPDEELKEDKIYKALWEKDKYGIVLMVTDIGVFIIYSMDSNKAKKFYTTMLITDLMR